jgi:dCTP diphosphatase
MTGLPEGDSVSLGKLKQMMAHFAKERDWDQYHTPRNLLLAMVILS